MCERGGRSTRSQATAGERRFPVSAEPADPSWQAATGLRDARYELRAAHVYSGRDRGSRGKQDLQLCGRDAASDDALPGRKGANRCNAKIRTRTECDHLLLAWVRTA